MTCHYVIKSKGVPGLKKNRREGVETSRRVFCRRP
jgi:hypothetical protein